MEIDERGCLFVDWKTDPLTELSRIYQADVGLPENAERCLNRASGVSRLEFKFIALLPYPHQGSIVAALGLPFFCAWWRQIGDLSTVVDGRLGRKPSVIVFAHELIEVRAEKFFPALRQDGDGWQSHLVRPEEESDDHFLMAI